jgi:ATP-dependent RNA helicase DeaD
MPPEIRKVAKRYLREPVEIKIKSKTSTLETTTQRYCQVVGRRKIDALTLLLEVETFDAMIVFVRTKNATVELAEKLEARGYSCAALNGDVPQRMREQTVDRLKRKAIDILIATDVAARGLDVDRISHVINYDMPYDTEAYVHRIGRTGRAGRVGHAILFVSPRERHMLRQIERATRQPIEEMFPPSHSDIVNRRVDQFKQLITDAISSQDLTYFDGVVAQYQQEQNTSPREIASALAYLLQKDRPLVVQERAPEPRRERRDFEDRPQRNDRFGGGGGGASGGDRKPDESMTRYRIEVGREHGAQPGNIVGAIANEVGIDSQYIGHIKLYDRHSTVDLPEGMPRRAFQHLKTVYVCGRELRISVDNGSSGGRYDKSSGGAKGRPNKGFAKKHKKKKKKN